MMIAENIRQVRERIENAARLRGQMKNVTLVAVTKQRTPEEIGQALACGVTDIGENRVQEAKEKYGLFKGADIKRHLVGHLQSNKAKDAVKIFDLIHSVDSRRLAREIDRQARKIGKVQHILIEVNTSGERTKFGVAADEVEGLVKEIVNLTNIRLKGMMTMAPAVKKPEDAAPYFRMLRDTKKRSEKIAENFGYTGITELSMGMSQDFETAVREGATIVRIGTAIFEG